jgi:DNA polymerase III subunit delta'
VSWPPALAGSPAVAVIERAIARQRLAHSLLLHGDDLDTLAAVAQAIADRLLHPAGSAADFRPSAALGSHPDLFQLRPAGKSRQITAEATRDLIANVQMSPRLAPTKVAIIHEADRMNTTSANIFLKTLEEPPERTVLLLLTTHPYVLLPTIRSRCLHFRFPTAAGAGSAGAEGWAAWLDDYRGWLGRLADGAAAGKTAVADHVMTLYGLVARFGAILDQATAKSWEAQKASLPPDLEENEQVAIEIGLTNGWRARLFAEIEQATRAFARPRYVAGDDASHRALAGAIQRLEHDAGLLRLNLNESAVLEDFLLCSLRLWSRAARK